VAQAARLAEATGLKQSSFSIQWLILGIALSILAAATGSHLYFEHRRVEDREQDRLMAQTRVIQENVEASLSAVNSVLADLSREHDRHIAARDMSNDMATLTDAMPGVRTLVALDAKGEVYASNRPELLGRNFAFREYFDKPRRHPDADMLYVAAPLKTSLGVYGVMLTRTVSGPQGQFAGAVVATLDPDYFKTLMASVLYAPDMWTGITHGEGLQFMLVPGREEQTGRNIAQPGSFFTRHLESGQEATVMTGIAYATGDERILAQRSVRLSKHKQDVPLVVAASRNVDAVFEPWRRDVRMQAGIFILIAAMASAALSMHQRRYAALMRKEADAAAALADSERFMRVLTDNIPGMVGYWTPELRCRFANRSYLEWFGKTAEQMRDIRMQDMMGEELFRKNEPFVRAALAGERQHFERTLVKVDGSIGYTWAQYIPDTDGDRVKGFYVLVTDVTDLKKAQMALADSERKLKTIIEAEPECVKVLARDGAVLQMNRAGLEMLEADSADAIIGRKVDDFVSPEFRAAVTALNERVCLGESGSLEFEITGLKGGHRWVDTRAVPMRDVDGGITGVLAVTRDITAHKKAEQVLEQLAQTDFLTGVANRRHFMVLAEQELSRSQRYGGPLSVFMIDVDHFKAVNDCHGHKIGDKVLQTLGVLSRQALRDVDVIGRLGGEEFGVVLPQTDFEHAMEVAERLRKTIAAAKVPIEEGLPLGITVSIGVTTLVEPDVNIDTLLNQADQALYLAKNQGRNRTCGYPETTGGGMPPNAGAA
jgi:diguanylate cyclase (GGDEF)-like protein/PAS domain S-box-containing protein